MISEERLSKALTYLAETDEKAAKAKGYMLGLDRQTKTIEGILFVQMPNDMTVAEKNSRVQASNQLKEHNEKYVNAVVDFETVKNKRETENLVIEVWRSLNASRRKGNI